MSQQLTYNLSGALTQHTYPRREDSWNVWSTCIDLDAGPVDADTCSWTQHRPRLCYSAPFDFLTDASFYSTSSAAAAPEFPPPEYSAVAEILTDSPPLPKRRALTPRGEARHSATRGRSASGDFEEVD